MKIHSSPKNGYASLMVAISISLTLMLISLTAFRESKHAQTTQKITQVKIDYEQKERAFLRSLLDVVPNSAMKAMMKDSKNVGDDLKWQAIFAQALEQSGASQSLDPSLVEDLGLPENYISSNTGDANYTPAGLISSPDGSGNFVFPSTATDLSNLPEDFPHPPTLNWEGSGSGNDMIYPIVGFNKRLSGDDQFSLLPYPKVAFGYSEQGQNFIAKRNWWTFTVDWGAALAADSGIASHQETYVLSLYEVPGQLALSSSGTATALGKFSDGTDWDEISIEGSIFAHKARVKDLTGLGTISSRTGVELDANAPEGQSIGGLAERREERNLSDTFYAYSSSADSGLVSFTPINRGFDFFDFFSHVDDSNAISPTGWNEYSIGAGQCKMTVDVCQLYGGSSSNAYRLMVAPQFSGSRRPVRCSRGGWWNTPGEKSDWGGTNGWNGSPEGDDWPFQDNATYGRTIGGGRRYITLDLEKLPHFLSEIGADDITENNSLWVGVRYNGPNEGINKDPWNSFGNDNIAKPNFPSTNDDFALVITNSSDLSEFTNGFTLITPMRVYFADDFNTVPTTPPAGSGITDDWYPPVSVYAPEKRFGIELTGNGFINLKGQVGYLPSDEVTSELNPLDFREGGQDTFNANNVTAELQPIERVEDVPPINSMSWMTVIERVH
ncbi:MAG: hypothetical protein Q7Q71_07670 [Verrucomicrobiota bacterium JB023]|nr:hypothetical protein [Verrucomicrobiota bacterium JB023]